MNRIHVSRQNSYNLVRATEAVWTCWPESYARRTRDWNAEVPRLQCLKNSCERLRPKTLILWKVTRDLPLALIPRQYFTFKAFFFTPPQNPKSIPGFSDYWPSDRNALQPWLGPCLACLKSTKTNSLCSRAKFEISLPLTTLRWKRSDLACRVARASHQPLLIVWLVSPQDWPQVDHVWPIQLDAFCLSKPRTCLWLYPVAEFKPNRQPAISPHVLKKPKALAIFYVDFPETLEFHTSYKNMPMLFLRWLPSLS